MRLFFLFSCLLPFWLQARSPLPIDVSAKAAILINAETGAILWEKNAHTPLFPSSTTKVFTAVYAMEKKGFALDEMVTASHDAVLYVQPQVRRAHNSIHPPYRLEVGGTHMGIKPGETLSLRTLLYGLMLSSGNDAANVIAQHVSGDINAFMEEVTQYARDKGCKNTILYTPHGLPCDKHKTSAYDLSIIAREFMKSPILREIAKTIKYRRPQTNKQPESVLHQHNALLKPGRFYYPKATGIKTGYTTAGGYSLVAAAEDTQRKLIAVVMGCEKIEHRFKDAIAIFEAGFQEKKVTRTLFSRGFDLFTQHIEGGKLPLQAYLAEDVVLEYFPSEEPVFKTSIVWQPSSLPITAGQVVAQMQVSLPNGHLLASAPLYAVRNVDATLHYQISRIVKQVKRILSDNATLALAVGGILLLIGTFYYSHRSHRRVKSKAHTAPVQKV